MILTGAPAAPGLLSAFSRRDQPTYLEIEKPDDAAVICYNLDQADRDAHLREVMTGSADTD